MSIRDILRRSGRSLKSAKARTLLTALAISVGTFALTLTLAASNGASEFVNKIISENFDPAELIVTADPAILGQGATDKPQEYNPNFSSSLSAAGAPIQVKYLDDNDIEKLKNTQGVEQVRRDIQLNLQYVTRKDQKKYIATVQTFSPAQQPALVAGAIPQPLHNNQILLPEAYLEPLGFKSAEEALGQTIVLAVRKPVGTEEIQLLTQQGNINESEIQSLANSSTYESSFTVAAVLKKPTTTQPGTELYMFAGEDDMAALNDVATQGTPNYHKYAFAYVRVKDGNDESKLNEVQATLENDGYTAQSVKDTQDFLNQIIGVLRGIVAAFGAIAVIASVFGIINTMYISVLQRTREIGLMKALGMRNRDVGRLFRFEAAWIGFLGGLIGALLAVALGVLLNPWITSTLELEPDQKLLVFRLPQILVLIMLLIIVSVLAGYLPSRKAAKLNPIEALRTE